MKSLFFMKSYALSSILIPIFLLISATTILPNPKAYGEVVVTSYGSSPISNGNLYYANQDALHRALLDAIQKFFNARPWLDQPTKINKDFKLFINSYSIVNRSISEENTRVTYIARVYLDDEALAQWNNIIGLTKTYSTLWYDLYINGNRETTSIYEGVGQLMLAKLKDAQYYSATKQGVVSSGVDIINDEGYNQAYTIYSEDREISRLVYTSINLQYDDETESCTIATETSALYKIGSPKGAGVSPVVSQSQEKSLDACINDQLPSIVDNLGSEIATTYYTNNDIQSFQLIIENMKDMVYINNMLAHLSNRRYITNSSLKSLSTTNITYSLNTTFDIKFLSTKVTQYVKSTPVVNPQVTQLNPPAMPIPMTEQTPAMADDGNNNANANVNAPTNPNTGTQPEIAPKPYNVEMRRTPTYIRLIF